MMKGWFIDRKVQIILCLFTKEGKKKIEKYEECTWWGATTSQISGY